MMSFMDDIFNASPAPADALRTVMNQNAAGTFLEAAGNLTGAINHIQYGIQAQQAAKFQADQLRIGAGQQMASAERSAYDVDKEAQYITSAALAAAASSGGGASDPTVVNLMARNAGEMAYRKSVALYQGEDRARLMQAQADSKEYEGGNILANSVGVAGAQALEAPATIMRGAARGASLYQRFAGNGPNASGQLTGS